MTDQLHKHTDAHDNRLSIHQSSFAKIVVGVSSPAGEKRSGGFVMVPANELLAMIDAADPDAMRAYLRETVEHEVPEADSPEDIDEPAVIELSDDIDTRLHVIERLAKILRAGTDAVEVCTLADWVIDR